MTGVAPVDGASDVRNRLRRATEVLREGADTAHEWRDQDVAEVADAVAEHLLAIAARLPSSVPAWLVDWQRLARRYGAVVTPLAEDPGGGVDALIDIKVRLEQVADCAERSASRAGDDR